MLTVGSEVEKRRNAVSSSPFLFPVFAEKNVKNPKLDF